MTTTTKNPLLRSAVGRSGFFALAFGAIVGSGWVVVLGQWLKEAGPGGSAAAFIMGGAVMMLVGLCYGELAARSSTAGGEFLYTLETLGALPAFLVAWFLTLYQVAVCAFEGIALAWLVRTLFPQVALGTAYTIAGTAVTWDALIIGVSAAMILGLLHLRGASAAIRFQNIVTFSFLGVITILIVTGFSFGSIRNLEPLLPPRLGHSALLGVLWTFATSAYFLNGWQAALHAIEERAQNVTARSAVLSMVAAIGVSAAFYALVIITCSMALPWQSLVTRELPAAAAFRSYGSGILGDVVLVAAIVSLTKTWSATTWIGSRLLFAQARHGLLPRFFGTLRPASRSPGNAVVFVTACAIAGIALGRSAILPIVDTLSICTALIIILCLLVLLRRRRLAIAKERHFSVPGGVVTIWCALISASSMIGIAVVQPLLGARGTIPLEWILLASWGTVGLLVWFCTRKLRRRPIDIASLAVDINLPEP
jgi:basic amino acid/polyamine antiporter, APA family